MTISAEDGTGAAASAVPQSAAVPANRASIRPTRWEPFDHAVVAVMVTLLVLTQRLGLPVGGTTVSVALPLCYLLLLILIGRGKLAISRLRAELFLLLTTLCLTATVVLDLRGESVSLPSLALLIVIYLPWILRAAGPDGPEAVRRAGLVFIRVMLLLAAVGALQFSAQLAGVWRYEDYLADWIPAQYLIQGFNSVNPLVYGSDIIKSTAFLLLEPSLLSQFCALAAIVAVALRRPAWQVLLLVAGMASAVSGTGILLLLFSCVVMLVRAPRMIRPGYVVTLVGALVLVLLSPIAALLLDRTDEVSEPRTSGYARFVSPYLRVAQGLEDDPVRYLTGAGPGMADQLLRTSPQDNTLFSVVPKLAFEYGLVVGGIAVVFLVVALLDRAPWRVVPSALVVATFFLQGGLLQPQTAFLAWALTGLGADEGTGRPTAATDPPDGGTDRTDPVADGPSDAARGRP